MEFAQVRLLSIRIGLLLLLILLNATALFADSVNTTERTVTKVAEGVYVIRHKDAPDGFPQGNTTVIIGDREVFVVDSCYLPSSAREDIAQIRQWTNKPVRYLLNTHWHYDHTLGNVAYADAFPSLQIIAHMETRNLEAVLKAIDMTAWRQKFAGDDKDNREFFDGFSLPGLVTAAYAEVWGR